MPSNVTTIAIIIWILWLSSLDCMFLVPDSVRSTERVKSDHQTQSDVGSLTNGKNGATIMEWVCLHGKERPKLRRKGMFIFVDKVSLFRSSRIRCRKHLDSSAESLETHSRGNSRSESAESNPHLDSTMCVYNSQLPPAIPHSAIHEQLSKQDSPQQLETLQRNARADDLAAALQLVKLQRFNV
jgi:hypothetical protein